MTDDPIQDILHDIIAARDIRFKDILKYDPCSYCFGPGGTVDHIEPRKLRTGIARGDWYNKTGACRECNRKKDLGGNNKYRTPLEVLAARRDRNITYKNQNPEAWLELNEQVITPFGRIGKVHSFNPLIILMEDYEKFWRCANPSSLKKVEGKMFANAGPQDDGTRTADQWWAAMGEDVAIVRTHMRRVINADVIDADKETITKEVALARKEARRLVSDIERFAKEIHGIEREEIDKVRT